MVSLNTATAEELADALDGVGVTRAELIIQYREENGSFSSVEELLEIKGIGVATLEKNKDRIQL
ncbi:ComEA family DNA-binding protein [Microbulbifer agarilyticus]|nr:ComEA family DNA-binding protein [Microbulbifer agarilyticus]MBY6210971.1 ComEA family DNA-binding protein [Microbulbifer agarilyticus]